MDVSGIAGRLFTSNSSADGIGIFNGTLLRRHRGRIDAPVRIYDASRLHVYTSKKNDVHVSVCAGYFPQCALIRFRALLRSDRIFGGDELMHRGIYLDPELVGDYQSRRIVLKAAEK